MAHKNSRIAVDIGGTFTDICVLDETTGELRIGKTSSTPSDPMQGALDALRVAGVELGDVSLFSHGTTVATNALITRNLPRSAMVCTEGYRDVVEIRRSNKEDPWDTYKDVAPPYIRRRDRLTVPERIGYDGSVLKPLDENAAREVARILKKRGVEAVAVCFFNSFLNPVHEDRMVEILAEELPGVAVVSSSGTLPEIFEHERFSTAMVNAILNPVAGNYVRRLSEKLKEGGYDRDLLMLHTGGGVMTANATEKFAGRLAGSGIAAGAIACRYLAANCGYRNAIGLDMGGTSTDLSLVHDGEIRVTKDWHIEFGYPIRFPSIEVLTIGAGGGSLAWIDETGSLHNGPQSAGSDPGPACYPEGGSKPTNTDANLVLGRLGTSLAGGQVTLSPEKAARAIDAVIGEPLGLSTDDAAQAIISVANANMSDAVRLISVSRGYDPRDFVLVAMGGAGALHCVALAKDLSIPTVLVPPSPGVAAALGCLLVDIRHDYSLSYLKPISDASPQEIDAAFVEMEVRARAQLESEGVAPQDMILSRSADMMYQGQWRSMQIPVVSPITELDSLAERFHENHEREYAYRRDDARIDLFGLNVQAVGLVAKARFKERSAGETNPAPLATRMVRFDESDERIETPIYDHAAFAAGSTIEGPAILELLDATVIVPPATRAEIDKWSNTHIHILGGA